MRPDPGGSIIPHLASKPLIFGDAVSGYSAEISQFFKASATVFGYRHSQVRILPPEVGSALTLWRFLYRRWEERFGALNAPRC